MPKISLSVSFSLVLSVLLLKTLNILKKAPKYQPPWLKKKIFHTHFLFKIILKLNQQKINSHSSILDDKNFIFAEYNQLNKMAEENLKLREIQSRKRRRISGSDTVRKEIEDDSSLSGWSGVSQNVNTERVVSPSPHIQMKKTYERYCAPMNYDQGTQTDSKITGSTCDLNDKIRELQKLIEMNEYILSEQKLLRNETKQNRFLLENFAEEFSAIRKSIQSLETKMDTQSQYQAVHDDQEKKKILNGTQLQEQPIFIYETTEAENASISLTNGSNVEYLEELRADDSDRSASRISYHDQTSMMSNTSMDTSRKDGNGNFRRSHSSSNFSGISSTPLARSNSSSNLIEEWAEMEGDVVIGSNQTALPVHILRQIDWKNYKAATRKLLVSLFPRAVLASRSLTGRPSPAFHDRNKPVKEKLDQNIINDIIQIITRKCGVHESQVRTAITTKCADENKMMRSREGKSGRGEGDEKFKAPSNVNDDKENVLMDN